MLSSLSNKRNMTALALSAALLTACASTPSSNILLTGISDADLAAKPANVDVNGLRAASDPVCVQFYENSVAFARAAETKQPNPWGQFAAATGISVAAAVLTNGLFRDSGNSVGAIAARSATSQAIFIGSNQALSGLNSSRGSDKKIIEQAEKLSCPVNVT